MISMSRVLREARRKALPPIRQSRNPDGDKPHPAVRGIVGIATAGLAFFLSWPLLQLPQDPQAIHRGFVAVVVKYNHSVARWDHVAKFSEVVRDSSGYADGRGVDIDIPRDWAEIWTVSSIAKDAYYFQQSPRIPETSEVAPKSRELDDLVAAARAEGDAIEVHHQNAPSDNGGPVSFSTGSDSWPWLMGGGATVVTSLPDVLVVMSFSASEASNPKPLACPVLTQSVALPIEDEWRAQFPGPALSVQPGFAVGTRECETGGSADHAVWRYDGVAISLTDRQKQDTMVPKALLAGAALGVSAQLIVDTAGGLSNAILRLPIRWLRRARNVR